MEEVQVRPGDILNSLTGIDDLDVNNNIILRGPVDYIVDQVIGHAKGTYGLVITREFVMDYLITQGLVKPEVTETPEPVKEEKKSKKILRGRKKKK